MKNWFLPSILTLVFWGVWGFIPKLTTKYINPLSAVIFEALGVMIVGIVVLFVVGFRPEIQVWLLPLVLWARLEPCAISWP